MHIYIKSFNFFAIICIQLCLFCTAINAQNFEDKNYYLVDSLEFDSLSAKEFSFIKKSLSQFHQTQNDSVKLEIIFSVITESTNANIKRKYNLWAIDYVSKDKAKYTNTIVKSNILANNSFLFKTQGDYDRALEEAFLSLAIRKKQADINKIANSQNSIAELYKKKGDFLKSLEYYKKTLLTYKSLGNKKEEGRLLNTIGYLHLNFGMHSQALSYFHKSLKVRTEIGDEKGMSYCFNNIASVHKQQGNPKVALEYYHKSLKIRKQIGYKAGVSVSLNNIGVVYKNERNFDQALKYYQESLKIKEVLKDKKGIAHVLNNIGTIYNEQEKLDMALAKYEESLKMTTALNDEKWMAITLFNMGNVYQKKKDFSKASYCALRSLEISKRVGQPKIIRDAAGVLKNIYSRQYDWKNAFEMQELYMTMRDSIRNKNSEVAATEQRINYEVEKKEQEIKLLSVKNTALQSEKEVQELKINKSKIVNAIFLIGSIVAIFLAIFFYFVLKKSKAVNKLLKKQDGEKQVMLKEIHHRVKNNLQVINSLLRLQSKEIKDVEIVEKFKETQKRVITIAALHEKMYRSDDLRHINLKDHIESIVEDLVTAYAIDKKIDIHTNIEDISIGLRTLVPLGLIINEIIVNSLKYGFNNVDEGTITLQIKKVDAKTFEMIIGDDGIGLRSYNNTSGLGSKLIRIFTKQLNGTLELLEASGTIYKIIFERVDPL